MTIKELYNWGKKNNALDSDIVFENNEFHVGKDRQIKFEIVPYDIDESDIQNVSEENYILISIGR